jgi:hypothetical protein
MKSKSSLAEALSGESSDASDGEHDGEEDAYVSDLAEALDIEESKAHDVYDVICAIVEGKSASGSLTIKVE